VGSILYHDEHPNSPVVENLEKRLTFRPFRAPTILDPPRFTLPAEPPTPVATEPPSQPGSDGILNFFSFTASLSLNCIADSLTGILGELDPVAGIVGSLDPFGSP
jgi:hypothetical protein